ncbi:hypothetical protein CFC21_072119 [Triticum aestivum]|uniref:DUF6598 domain-containing protein n=2 Tax=Triticum aestivum TaxID=4565 RepID=A0A3B6LNM9_WHEAT|nr:uncharacterized protein LOC123116364 isoform X1 [Triticum aestivum]KAF7066072.1 hypothetical protein CFC21_072119 [Triticum aestivum]
MLGETQLPVTALIGRKRRWDKDAAAASYEEASDGDGAPKEQAPMAMEIAASPTTRDEEKQEDEDMAVPACKMGEQPLTEIESSTVSTVEEKEVTKEPEIPMWDSDDDGEFMLKAKAELEELHIACVKSITELDPKSKLLVPTRFCSFNIAGFDLDKESKFGLGPPLDSNITPELEKYMVSSAVNVISVKVIESDRGYPISVYGTVLARDRIDYRCIYLFRRGREDPQMISSKDDMLTLTGPRRALVPPDNIYFEFNLRVKGDAGDGDFSKGVIQLHVVPYDPEPITRVLSSWLSRVELVLAPVDGPVAASLEVKILKGAPPFIGKICAGTSENPETQMIVYDSRDMKSDSSVVLSRNLVAVPDPDDEEEEIIVHVRFLVDGDDVDDEDAGTLVSVAYPAEEQVCSHGA